MAGRRGDTYCHRNVPSLSRKHISTAMSIGTGFLVTGLSFLGFVYFGSRGLPLLVPTQTRPLAITGPPMLRDPSSAVHKMFRALTTTPVFSSLDSTCQSVGVPFSG